MGAFILRIQVYTDKLSGISLVSQEKNRKRIWKSSGSCLIFVVVILVTLSRFGDILEPILAIQISRIISCPPFCVHQKSFKYTHEGLVNTRLLTFQIHSEDYLILEKKIRKKPLKIFEFPSVHALPLNNCKRQNIFRLHS